MQRASKTLRDLIIMQNSSAIPDDLLLSLFVFLTPAELACLDYTCKTWRSLIAGSSVWEQVFSLCYRVDKSDQQWLASAVKESPNLWKSCYIRRHRIDQNWLAGRMKSSSFIAHGGVHSLAALPERGIMAYTAEDDKLHLASLPDFHNLGDMPGCPVNMNQIDMWEDTVCFPSLTNIIQLYNLSGRVRLGALQGHSSWINGIKHHGGRLASGSGDRTLRVWDIKTESTTHCLEKHTESILSVDWVDSNIVVSGSKDAWVHIWDLRANASVQSFHEHGTAWSVHCRDNSVVAGFLTGRILEHDLRRRGIVRTLKLPSAVGGVYLDSQRRILAASDDGFLTLWKDELRVNQWKDHSSWIYGFYADAERCLTGDDAGKVVYSEFY